MPNNTEDAELVLRSGLFNHVFYGGLAPAAGIEPLDAARHYLRYGEAAGLCPSPLFKPAWYANRWNASHPLLDYIANGGTRDPHLLFDTAFYLNQNLSLFKGETPLAHYERVGWRDGLDPHPLFSTRYYIAENADVVALGYNPLEHFLTNGWLEGRKPCPEFDTKFYLTRNPDVAHAGLNPLLHYASNGAAEARDPSAEFETTWYNAQLRRKQGVPPNPLVHYRLFGKAAGWLPQRKDWHLDPAGMLAAADAAAWASNAHVQAAAVAGGSAKPVVTVLLGEKPPPIPADGLILVLQVGDRLHPDAPAIVAAAPGLLTTFDAMALDQDGRVLPVLLPGANRLALANAPTPPPFCVEAGFCRTHGLPATAEPAIVLPWFRALVSDAAAAYGLRHRPVPIAIVPLDRHRPTGPAPLPEVARIADAVCAEATVPPGTVSAVICTKDAGHLLIQLVFSLTQLPPALLREIVLVVNRPLNAFAFAYHAKLRSIERVKLVEYDKPYNFSDQANVGAQATDGDFVLLLNDDIVPIGPHWLSHLLAPFARPELAIAGPLLLYPDETVQHAGMFMGFNGVAGHTLRGARLPDVGTAAGLLPQEVAAVTGAVMLVRRSVWEALTGFDTQFATYLQDVDFCMRASRMGWEIAFTPDSVLFHMESTSAKPTLSDPAMLDRRGREHARFARRWGCSIFDDPFRSPHLAKQDETSRTITAIGPAELREVSGG